MCFSASASFAASGVLAVVGVASYRIANKKQKILAVVPLLFAVQQAMEGFQWVSFDLSGKTNLAFGYGFLFFAFMLWPIYVPTAVFMFDDKRQRVLRWLISIGVMISFVLFGVLIFQPLSIQVCNRSIYYHVNAPFGMVGLIFYLIAVCGSLIISSKPAFRLFGAVAFLSVALTMSIFFKNFVSVWCFFGALLSSLIYFYLKQQKNNKSIL